MIGVTSSAIICDPIVVRYPVAGPHNNGYDVNWATWTCGTTHANSDYASWHLGNDIFGARGTTIVAAQGGTIGYSFFDATGGNVVYIVDACGWTHYYAHLDTIDPGLFIGQTVKAGTRLGTLGNTGSASGTQPHLHYSIYPGDYSQGEDPQPLLHAVEEGSCDSGNRCTCADGTNVGNYSIPVTDTDCGHRVCGTTNELWECTTSNMWSRVSAGCTNTCSCPLGLFEDGREIPVHMTHCGYRVCGTNSRFWDCTPAGWDDTGVSCGDGLNGDLPRGTNWALSAISAVTDSSFNASFAGNKAKDGLTTQASKWTSTNSSNTHWLRYDLGASRRVTGFVVRHAGAAGEDRDFNTSAFSIQRASSSGGRWTDETIVNNSGRANVTMRSYATPKSMRHVRLRITDPGIDSHARIPELEVWGE